LDPDKDAINYILAGSVRHGDEIKNEFILFATDDETVKSHIAMLEEAELRPVAIDVIPCALFRSFERNLRRQEDRERTVIFVDIGSRTTSVVFGRGAEISFVKQIAIGGERFDQEVAARLGINVNEVQMLRGTLRMERSLPGPQSSFPGQNWPGQKQQLDASTRQAMVDAITTVAQELAGEISLCFRYYTVTFRGKRVDRAIFSGGQAYESILLDILRQQLKIEIDVAEPLKGFNLPSERTVANLDSDRRGLLCEWAVAVGLSLKGYSEATSEQSTSQTQKNEFVYSDNYERD